MPESEDLAYLNRRRQAVAERWNLKREVVLVWAGQPLPIPGRGDRVYPFRSHSEYFYLTDRERPGGVIAFDADEGWVDFVVPVTRSERLWDGADPKSTDGTPITELEPWLAARSGRPIASLGAPGRSDIRSEEALVTELRRELNFVRRQKDELELDRMRRAESATRAGFARIEHLIEEGRTEREIQIELEAEFMRHGGDFLAFETIVAGGPHSAVLHCRPGHRRFAKADLVLIDAGAEFRGYASDITRTYPASGRFTSEQRELYNVVRQANLAAIERCVAGTEWRDVHRTASLVIARGLADFGLLRGDPESLVDRGAQSVFFPHGVGHMVGLGIRDAGEALPGREPRPNEFPQLRVDLPLMPNHVVTVEPGIYLVPALVEDPEFRDRYRDAVAWDRAEQMLGFGGIRIEDNVLVTDDRPEVLTANMPVSEV